MSEKTIRIGTRGSQLALYQAELVRGLIRKHYPCRPVKIVTIRTSGDNTASRGVDPFETKRVFTKEIEQVLLEGEIDLAVHSAKDLAVDLPPGTRLSAVPAREDSRDCFLSNEGHGLMDLPAGSVIGTSSVRRQVQVLRWRPDLVVRPIRGNVETRIAKMKSGDYQAIILAYAGLKRVHLTDDVTEVLDPRKFYPAPGQGVLAIQIRKADPDLDEVCDAINDAEGFHLLECERAFLRRLEGGCQLPCGIWLEPEGRLVRAGGGLFALDERDWVEAEMEGSREEAAVLGQRLAEDLLARGGDRILEALRRQGRQTKPES